MVQYNITIFGVMINTTFIRLCVKLNDNPIMSNIPEVMNAKAMICQTGLGLYIGLYVWFIYRALTTTTWTQ